jgi:hypothetical protein
MPFKHISLLTKCLHYVNIFNEMWFMLHEIYKFVEQIWKRQKKKGESKVCPEKPRGGKEV